MSEEDRAAEFQRLQEQVDAFEKGLTLAEWRKLPDAELVRRFDLLVTDTTTGLRWIMGAQDYLDELGRRDAQRINDQMLTLTRDMHRMTVVITVLTIVNLIVAAVAIYVAAD